MPSNIDRRKFLLALAAAGGSALGYDEQKRRRVGLIGTGWYGKSDLFRLIQIAPASVEEAAADLQRLSRDAEGEGPGYC
jgi:hypothetical protein